ncbi:unnamed protein product [Brassicogethes aeneus]|uniref:Uncharacterized protein n=1 Tax=Brassicogethes aeneus TaxID=1431903 RepID=A0A9P0B442_BRAAE|nr:unnamed protein product [Brassicogethes aeneus]
MFKLIDVCLAVFLLGTACAYDINHFENRPNLQVFENYINQSVECVRQTLADGMPDHNLPSFNPLTIKHYTVDLDKYNFSNASGYVTIDNGIAENIVNFIVSNLKGKFVLVPPTISVDFTIWLENVTNVADYKTDMTIMDQKINGQGKISIGLVGLNVTGHVKAIVKKGKVELKELSAPALLKALDFKITGLYDDEEYSAKISKEISEKVPEQMNNNPELFIEVIGPLFVEVFNALLNDKIGWGIIKAMTQKCILDIFPQ